MWVETLYKLWFVLKPAGRRQLHHRIVHKPFIDTPPPAAVSIEDHFTRSCTIGYQDGTFQTLKDYCWLYGLFLTPFLWGFPQDVSGHMHKDNTPLACRGLTNHLIGFSVACEWTWDGLSLMFRRADTTFVGLALDRKWAVTASLACQKANTTAVGLSAVCK